MLCQLNIRHFALIDQLELNFSQGFSVISGETGAGKSILVDALTLLAGGRGDSGLVAQGAEQAELTGAFDLSERADVQGWLADQALAETEPHLIVRRVIPTTGSSRAWINGRPATISQLAELGQHLIDIHGQHEHQRLAQADTQRDLVDQHVPAPLTEAVWAAHGQHRAALQALTDFEQQAGDAALVDLLSFQVRELEDLGLGAEEYAQLTQRQLALSRAGDIDSAVAQALTQLDGDDDHTVRAGLIAAEQALSAVSEIKPSLTEVHSLLAEALVNVDEAIAELERHGPDEDMDPAELAQLDRRLARCVELARKHRCTPDQLPTLTHDLRTRLDGLADQDAQRQRLAAAVQAAEQAWQAAAKTLSTARQKAAQHLAEKTCARLADLGMDQAQLTIEVSPDPRLRLAAHGGDRIAILFSANPGQSPKPLAKVASGGELSRISLALMLVAQAPDRAVSRVFDEVDAGIGGETAEVVGQFLHQVARQGQAFCVTHLAQVAARADHQYQVRKSTSEGRTKITVQALDAKARTQELARMLGDADGPTSLAHAKAMLKQRR